MALPSAKHAKPLTDRSAESKTAAKAFALTGFSLPQAEHYRCACAKLRRVFLWAIVPFYAHGPMNGSPVYVSESGSSISGQRLGSTLRRSCLGRGLPSQPTCSM